MKKLVIKVSMNGHTSSFFCFCPKDPQSKAMKLAAGFRGVARLRIEKKNHFLIQNRSVAFAGFTPGVKSVALTGDQDRIEVTGDVDAVDLATSLRKKVGFAEIVSVREVKIEEEKENTDDTKEVQPVIYPCPQREIVYLEDPYPQPWCWPF